jgi:hypothetical protein
MQGVPQSLSCAVWRRGHPLRNAGAAIPFSTVTMIDSFARVSGWQQLYHLWELIVMLCKFLWGLLRFLGGG